MLSTIETFAWLYVLSCFRQVEKFEDALKVQEPCCQWLILCYSAVGVAFIISSAITPFHYFLYLQMQVESFSNLLPMAQIEVPSEVWGTNHNFLPTFFSSFLPQVPFLNWSGCAVLWCTQDAGEQVCSRNHQIYKGNLIPFRENICFFNVQLPLHLPAIHERSWFLEEEIVDMPVYRCGNWKTFVLMFIIIWRLWNL